ncbi:hypothetical protein FN846DRAFT_931492 [Sphaerosporella brunnea]|uniref:RPEL repeat protein n=1 Tax=Sphaerosporella brunnea TaxID=1250544 RepID=A0A5J5F8C1_9PEZI|nr:hypothetical protein FN846DRAFT_931492 [Sphaerosporella brunnea]
MSAIDTAIPVEEKNKEVLVDESSISPTTERKNSLLHALAKRPEEKDLVDRNILHSGAPAIQQKQLELQKGLTTTALKKHLASRPTKEELQAAHILPENPNIAPALAAAQRELEKSMKEDALNSKLAARPSPEELVKKGVLSPEEDPTKA